MQKKLIIAGALGFLAWATGKHVVHSCGRSIDEAIDRAMKQLGAFYGFDTDIPA